MDKGKVILEKFTSQLSSEDLEKIFEESACVEKSFSPREVPSAPLFDTEKKQVEGEVSDE